MTKEQQREELNALIKEGGWVFRHDTRKEERELKAGNLRKNNLGVINYYDKFSSSTVYL